jgi:hypothetical protein
MKAKPEPTSTYKFVINPEIEIIIVSPTRVVEIFLC